MRVLFADGPNDRRERERARAAADAFWSLFESQPELPHREHERALREVHPDMCFETVTSADGAPEDAVVVRSDKRWLRPLVDEVVACAPRHHKILAQRPAFAFEHVATRFERAYGVSLKGARARAGFVRGHLLELVLYLPEPAGQSLDVDALAEQLLGERALDDWVGAVEQAPLPRSAQPRGLPVLGAAPTGPLALAELPEAVRAAIAGLEAGLDSRPMHQRDDAGWTMLEAEPACDCGGAAQDDVLLVSTLLPELVKSFLCGDPFASQRFSRAGERFAYLKLRRGSTPPERWLAERRALEDALDEALRNARAGSVFGNGLGLWHAYVDVALSDLHAGIAITRDVARRLGAPQDSWILFFDSDWAAEWIGVWEKTRPPPL